MTVVDLSKSKAQRARDLRAAASPLVVHGSLKDRAEAAALIAAQHAAAVDREARFPAEAMASLRQHGLMGIMVPVEFGGEGASISRIADVCYRLGKACSSTALIYAMHQAVVACVLRHGRHSPWHATFLRRLHAEQLLLASSTTEGQGGGNVRSSEAAVECTDVGIALERAATVISYAVQADAIATVARRAADAARSNQVLVVFGKDDYTLEPLQGWDTLGMRGTCSYGFTLRAHGRPEQVLPDAYEKIHAQSMVPVSHLCWAGVWAGIAAAAVERAQVFMRKAARGAGSVLPPGVAHYTRATASLRTLRSLIAASLRRYEAAADDIQQLASLDFQTAITLTKVDTSELAVATVMSSMRACGLAGYRNDGEYTIGRHLRDVLSSPIMINNDRILANVQTASLLSTVPDSISD